MTKGIYAIYDKSAQAIVGGLHLYVNDAAAIRFFGDVAVDPQTFVARHIEDHDLIKIGVLDEVNALVTDCLQYVEVITGTAWKAAQTSTEGDK
jgi:hypothetical protein